jgi:regulator of sirC expression with transglutaminase-like and TPR domain
MAEERPATQDRRVVTARRQAEAVLGALATRPDEAIDLAEAALALSALGARAIDPAPYRRHLSEIAAQVGAVAATSLGGRVEALNDVLLGAFGYHGDTLTYDDLDNADLARVIDRRKGLPVALGILYLHAARAQGWRAAGLGFPGHFLIRLERGGEAAVVDPFHDGRVLDSAGLRGLLKATSGINAELEPAHWHAVANRDVLLRLQNNIKARCIESGDTARALQAVEAMLMFAPDVAHLWRDAGSLNIKLGNLGAAVRALEHYVADGGTGPDHDEAEQVLSRIRRQLN